MYALGSVGWQDKNINRLYYNSIVKPTYYFLAQTIPYITLMRGYSNPTNNIN